MTETATPQPTGLLTYHPEMGEPRPDAQIDTRSDQKRWHLTSRIKLSGQGVRFVKTLLSAHLPISAHYKIGFHEYVVTNRAFMRICREHRVACELLL